MVRCFVRLSITTNGINNLPFVLSLSKDLFSVSLGCKSDEVCQSDLDSACHARLAAPFAISARIDYHVCQLADPENDHGKCRGART